MPQGYQGGFEVAVVEEHPDVGSLQLAVPDLGPQDMPLPGLDDNLDADEEQEQEDQEQEEQEEEPGMRKRKRGRQSNLTTEARTKHKKVCPEDVIAPGEKDFFERSVTHVLCSRESIHECRALKRSACIGERIAPTSATCWAKGWSKHPWRHQSP